MLGEAGARILDQEHKTDVQLGVNIMNSLVNKEGDQLVSAVAEYMRYFGLSACPHIVSDVPIANEGKSATEIRQMMPTTCSGS